MFFNLCTHAEDKVIKHSITASMMLLATQTAIALAQTPPAIPGSISTPNAVETPIGELEFKDGVPPKETAAKLYDNLDFIYAHRAFMDNMRGVSIRALHNGLQSIGVKETKSSSSPT